MINKIETSTGGLVNQKGIQLTKESSKDNLLFRVRKSSTIVNRLSDSLGKKK